MADQKETIVLDFQVDNKDAIISIENLTKANKELREERKKLDLASADGAKRAQEINSAIDKNTQVIKNNSSALEKQKMNVGNYTNSIKDAAKEINIAGVNVGGLTQKFELLSKSPLLIAITVLTAAFGTLMTYFKNTGEGEDKLAEITAGLSVVFEGLSRIVEAVGKMLFKTIEFVGSAALKIIQLVNPSAEAAIKAAVEAGKAIAKLDDEIDARETEMVIRRAETNNKVAKLREESIKQEGAQKRKTIEEAIQLEKDLSKQEVDLANQRVLLWEKQHKLKTDLTDDEKRKLAELKAAAIDADTAAYQNTIKLNKELENLNKQDVKKRKDVITQQVKEYKGALDIEYDSAEETERKKLESRLGASSKYVAQIAKEAKAHNDAENTKTQITRLQTQVRLANIATTLNMAAGLMEKGSAGYKALAISQASIDTYRAATSALAPPPEGAGPLFGPILAGVTIATGLANIAKIAAFSDGGYTGPGGKYQPAGIVHAGEVVWNQSDVAAVGGPAKANAMRPSYSDGGIVANSMTRGMGQMSSMPVPQVILDYKEFTQFVNRVQYKESLATA